ncbi:MAG: hypothetical protein OM95_08180 [Bdellovibrio sp. ArHS]|uniref:hypothetical protein n=1 Tax=Bdellovibrio sp. ArHS TaxID=1569284 RepID=UPI000582731D|nr:hypothetical protein [Bdellovibrio sp. ArHS]KHD88482.1 MAG: hypothetical protein OM95_08180 [Bdellovibrio sp. ArHS]
MSLKNSLLLTALTMTLGACGNGSGGGQPITAAAPIPNANPTPSAVVTEELTYEFSFNGCSTGRHKLLSKKEFCDALLNDALNNSCARELRIEHYNRHCTGTQSTSAGSLLPSSAARCIVSGMDLKDRTFIDNINPFNPQRRQSMRDMYWNGRAAQAYDLLFSSSSYGRARFIVTPASGFDGAQGEIFLQQQKGEEKFSARGGLGSSLRMVVTNFTDEKEVDAVCVSDKAFRIAKRDLKSVKCSFRLGAANDKNSVVREDSLTWDLSRPVQKEIFRNRRGGSIVVKLKPAINGEEERIEVETVELDIDKTFKAESALNEGLEIRYQGRQTRSDFVLQCAPASK